MGGGKGGSAPDNTAALQQMQQMNNQLMTQMMNMPKGLSADEIMSMMPQSEQVVLPEIETTETKDFALDVEQAQAKADAEQTVGQVRRPNYTYLDDDDEDLALTGSLLTGS